MSGPLLLLLAALVLGTVALVETARGDAASGVVYAILALVIVQLGRE